MRLARAQQIFFHAMVFLVLAGCSERPTTMGDLYLESRTALEAYKRGNYSYIPANGKITVTTRKDAAQVRVIAIGFVNDRKMALHLTFPADCLAKNAPCLRDANKEFDALEKCVDRAAGALPAAGSCSVSSLIINGEGGSIVKDRLHAPHMDVWVYDVD